jgi:flagellar hook protein FlgE
MSGYQFSFRVNGETKFQCRVQCERCCVNKPDGTQCKRNTCIGSPYCYIHLLLIRHLRIKKSTLPISGNGLFAMNPKAKDNEIIFKKGDTIIDYDGELINDATKTARYGKYTAPYAVECKKDCNVDCACERGVGSNANTNPNHNNATFSVNRARNTVKIVASKNIRNGDEIFLSYGKSFKLNEPTEHNTKYGRIKNAQQ